ncbi:MAG TPA: DUF5343 domain-containing protein [Gemmataceae bacterium]|jgi:hypothetical protein
MSLPDSYVLKPGSIPAYFDAILDAQAPERFSIKFLETLGFTSTNDRLLVGLLKELRFLNADGAPQQGYYEFLDRSRSKQVLAEAIREAFSDLFAINTKAHELNKDNVKNKLRTLYAGKKSDELLDRIARTFTALCEYADFSTPAQPSETSKTALTQSVVKKPIHHEEASPTTHLPVRKSVELNLGSLQYHINIVLPESRDQAVYDAIFKSLKEHLS